MKKIKTFDRFINEDAFEDYWNEQKERQKDPERFKRNKLKEYGHPEELADDKRVVDVYHDGVVFEEPDVFGKGKSGYYYVKYKDGKKIDREGPFRNAKCDPHEQGVYY